MRLPLKSILSAVLVAAAAGCSSSTGSDDTRLYADYDVNSLSGTWDVTYVQHTVCAGNIIHTTQFTAVASIGAPAETVTADQKQYAYTVQLSNLSGTASDCSSGGPAFLSAPASASVIKRAGDPSAVISLVVPISANTAGGTKSMGNATLQFETVIVAPITMEINTEALQYSLHKR